MKYLGIARHENGRVVMPDGFQAEVEGQTYDAIELGGNILLAPRPLNRERLARIERLAAESIAAHRKTLEGLAR